ncbi:MAG: histidine triad protein [Firmicutes bacterium]|nr:histidine triad protein [Bacillota bacterium]
MDTICITCRIINKEVIPPGGIIYKNNFVILHHCLDINIGGYFILSPVRHVEGLEQLEPEELSQIANLSKAIIEVLIKEKDIDRVYILSLGEETSHFHFHLFPRYKWMLDFPSEDICTNDKIDGGKLFSFIRNKYKVDKQELFDNRLLEILNSVREWADL